MNWDEDAGGGELPVPPAESLTGPGGYEGGSASTAFYRDTLLEFDENGDDIMDNILPSEMESEQRKIVLIPWDHEAT